MHTPFALRLVSLTRAWAAVLAALWLALGMLPAHAQQDPPGRVGRLAEVQGAVSWYDQEQGRWLEAERNLPLTGGDRISTSAQASAELRVGSTSLRLDGGSELEVLRLDDERLVFQLHRGSLALRVRLREVASEVEIVTAEARLLPLRAGNYRIDRRDDSTYAGSWRGDLRVDDEYGFTIATGQRVELWREGRVLRQAVSALPADQFADRVLRDEQREERSVAQRYVSLEMTGAEDLDRYGRWDQHPEYGAVWYPVEVRTGWAPYRYGRWALVEPWGWTWVDEAPWGFAPFHYGRWVYWRDRWGWVPGALVPRPVYAPALVAWIGGGGVGISIGIGGGPVGWVPLAPRERFVPWYRHTPVYVGRVNPGPRDRDRRDDRRDERGPVRWANQAAPGAVTMVPRDTLTRREPVWRSVVSGPQRPGAAQPWTPASAPQAPVRTPRPDRASDRGPDRATDRAPERGVDRAPDRGADRGPDRAADRPTQRPPERAPAFVGPAPRPVPQAPSAVPVAPPFVREAPVVGPQRPNRPDRTDGPRDFEPRRDRGSDGPQPRPSAPQPAPQPAQPQAQPQPQQQPQAQPQQQPQPQPQQQQSPPQPAPSRPIHGVNPQRPPAPAPAPVATPAAPVAPAAVPEAPRRADPERNRGEDRRRGPDNSSATPRVDPRDRESQR